MGPYASWWSSHFNFFNAQEDKITQYNAWKDLELKLHCEYRTEPSKFDINHYAMKYETVKTTYELKLLIEKQTFPVSQKDILPHREGSSQSSFHGGRGSRDHHQSFQQGSRSHHPVCCILCGELDHPVSKHYNDGITVTKFADGKPTWAKVSNNSISMERKSASTIISGDRPPPAAMPTVPRHISAPSAVPNPTMPLPGSVDSSPLGHQTAIDPLFLSIEPQFLHYRDFSDTIVHRDSLTTADMDFSDDIFLKIIHPYDTDAFDHLLSKHCLTQFYLLLIQNLGNGFPLGKMPPLMDMVIFKNHPSTLLFSDIVDKYLADELAAGHMSGPFTLQCVENTLRGPIFCSPLLVSIQTQQPGMPDKLHVCWHLSKGDKNTPSMNSHIQKEDFLTQFDTASRVADIVGYFLTSRRFFFFIHIRGPHLLVICLSQTLLLAVLFLMGFTPSGPIFTYSHLVVLHILWFFNLADSTSHVSMGPTSHGPIYLQFPHLVVLPLQAPHSRGPTFTASYLAACSYGFHIE